MLASFIYLALRKLIELVLLRPRSRQFQGARDRRASPRARDPAPPSWAPPASARRSSLPGRRQSSSAPRTLELVLSRAGNAASLASPAGGAGPARALDPVGLGSETRSERSCFAWRARTRAGAIGGSRASSPGSGSRSRRRRCESCYATARARPARLRRPLQRPPTPPRAWPRDSGPRAACAASAHPASGAHGSEAGSARRPDPRVPPRGLISHPGAPG